MPTEEELAEAAAAAAEARLAALAGGENDPPADPPAEEDPPAEDPPADPPAEDPQDPPADPPAAEDPPADPPPPPRGGRTLEARIGKLAGEKRALAQRAAAAEAELARLRAAQGGGDPPPSDPPADPPDPQRHQFRTQAEFDTAVAAEAERRAALADWNNRCNTVEDKGSKLPGWQEAKRSLALLDDNGVIPFALLEVALETDAPEKVILALGQDPDRAAEILEMRPARRALEIAKLSQGTAPKPAARSAAPPPVDPLRGRSPPAAAATPTDRDSDAEWLRKRQAEIEAKRIREATRQRQMS